LRRFVIVVAVVLVAVVAARVAAPAHEGHARLSAALACGVERWTVKTLQDRPRLLEKSLPASRARVSIQR
jgi:hypothetical protein